MKIVSWNCNGGFRKKYTELFNAYPDADLFMVQECENPDFYDSQEYKALFLNGFHVGTPDCPMKGIGIFAPKGNSLRRTKCQYGNSSHMLGYAFFEVDKIYKMLAVWPHGKYVEEMIDFSRLNEALFTKDLLIMGDTNSCSVFNKHHPKNKNHDVLVALLSDNGLVDAYNYCTGEPEGNESTPTFYLQRKKEKPYHLDRCFIASERIISFKVAKNHDNWLRLSDHIPIEVEIKNER